MTLDQFLEELAAVPTEWTVDPYSIRAVDIDSSYACCCPIVAVARARGNRVGALHCWLAAIDIGLAGADARLIVAASDFDPPPEVFKSEAALRPRLMSACRLTVVEPV